MDELQISSCVFVALYLLKCESCVVTPALVGILMPTIGPCHPHKLRQRFGQHAQALPAFFELLLRPFLLVDIGTGAKPAQDRPVAIFEWDASGQEPAISSCAALPDAMLHFIGCRGANGCLPHIEGAISIIRMQTLEPAVPL